MDENALEKKLDFFYQKRYECINFINPSSNTFDEKQSSCNVSVDISNQNLTKRQNALLFQIAEKAKLREKIDALFNGHKLNTSENTPALHTALRTKIGNIDASVYTVIDETISQMSQFVLNLKQNSQHKCITDIVNVGMGGSDLGPRFALEALKRYQDTRFSYHFISDCDPDHLDNVLKKLNPSSTLFIICSKSFTTTETIDNFKSICGWSNRKNYAQTNCIAVTANSKLARKFNIKRIFPIWPWIGGRFSFCSAINLILMIAIGPEKFQEMLSGAASMDKHFKETELKHNLPIILALADIFNINAREGTNRVMLIYSHALSLLVPFVQQLEMESNGKRMSLQGNELSYSTSEIVWGGSGNQAQHAYFQLLCQGTQFTPCDIICVDSKRYKQLDSHAFNVMETLKKDSKSKTNDIKKNIPFSLISLNDITPSTIGSLVALFEHKVFVKSVIWNINPFDQPGVEYAKALMKKRKLTKEPTDIDNETISS